MPELEQAQLTTRRPAIGPRAIAAAKIALVGGIGIALRPQGSGPVE